MKSSIRFAIFSIILLSSRAEAAKKCGFVCNDWDWGNGNETIDELILFNLNKEGHSDGICVTKDKWILNGEDFGLPTQCFCVEIPTDTCEIFKILIRKYKLNINLIDISPGQGPRCVDAIISSPEETFLEYFRRAYDTLGALAPPNGWCLDVGICFLEILHLSTGVLNCRAKSNGLLKANLLEHPKILVIALQTTNSFRQRFSVLMSQCQHLHLHSQPY